MFEQQISLQVIEKTQKKTLFKFWWICGTSNGMEYISTVANVFLWLVHTQPLAVFYFVHSHWMSSIRSWKTALVPIRMQLLHWLTICCAFTERKIPFNRPCMREPCSRPLNQNETAKKKWIDQPSRATARPWINARRCYQNEMHTTCAQVNSIGDDERDTIKRHKCTTSLMLGRKRRRRQ